MIDLKAEINQEETFVNIIQTKIKLVNPDVVFVEKDVSRKVLDTLFKDNRTVVTNINLKMLKMIARCTQTIICPNSNFISKYFVTGNCSLFNIEAYKDASVVAKNSNFGTNNVN